MRITVVAITLITLIAVVVVAILYGTDLFEPGIKPTPTPTPTPTPIATPSTSLIEATCIRVIDGDTIEVLIDGDKYKVLFTNMLTGQPIETDIPEFLKQCLKNMENLLQELRPTLPQESAGDV